MIVFMYASDIFSLNINILTFSDVSYNACNLVDVNKCSCCSCTFEAT